jgi:cytochrome c oxidase subunit 1
MTGRMLDERLVKVHFWLLFIGFHTTFLVQHWLGVEGMPRRYADYLASDGFTTLNQVSSVGAFLLGASTLPFLLNVYKSAKTPMVGIDDPWGWGRSLEWATSSPPPRHNFMTIPRIRSESPAFDLHHPEVAALELSDNPALADDTGERRVDAPEQTGRAEHLREQGVQDVAGDSDRPAESLPQDKREVDKKAGPPKRLQTALFVLIAVGFTLGTMLLMGYIAMR